MFPLVSHIEWSVATDLAIAAALGLGFGFCLERAGFGSARKLTAVFYLFDMAVVKVMFTAIVTCMTGIALLSAVGAVNTAEFYVEPTALPAQIIGGLLFGAGFMVGGYCPGTSMAAIATGRKDGLAFAFGMLAGVWAFAEFTPGLEPWIRSVTQGEMLLPSTTGIGMPWWTAGFIAFLLAAGRGMAWLETRFANWKPRFSQASTPAA
ncbi:MAG: DUF6691 family protein [Burkholderiaceae bacterium]